MGTEEQPHTEEVQTTKVVAGKVRFGLDQISNPTPDKWARISKGLKYFFTGAIVIVSGTPWLSSKAANITNFCIAIGILVLGAIDTGMGVAPTPKQDG